MKVKKCTDLLEEELSKEGKIEYSVIKNKEETGIGLSRERGAV